jgi:hypothetical protein
MRRRTPLKLEQARTELSIYLVDQHELPVYRQHLWTAISHANGLDLEMLRRGYPNEVSAFEEMADDLKDKKE